MEFSIRHHGDFFGTMTELHPCFDQISHALVCGKSVEEIARELRLELPEFVDLAIYLIGRYGLLAYRMYGAMSPAARHILAEIEKRWPVLGIDPRNLELALPHMELEGACREEIVLASICKKLLGINAFGLITTVEQVLGSMIRSELRLGYGDRWWREGVPVEIRKTCSSTQEEDPDPADEKYEYWTISHMASILEYRWAIFSKVLPKSITSDKKSFLSKLKQLNRLRNRIMHPIKRYEPTRDDLTLLEEVWGLLVFDYLGDAGKRIPKNFLLDLALGEEGK